MILNKLQGQNPLKGFTLIELIVTVAIVGILASATMPLLKMSVQRSKETELKQNLRTVRQAIDAYKQAVDEGKIKKSADRLGYPPDLQTLVDGVQNIKSPNKQKLFFLRKIPLDPMMSIEATPGVTLDASEIWGLRSSDSPPGAPSAGQDVFDVYSLSEGVGLNGVPYAQW